MVQDIFPHRFFPEYRPFARVQDDDFILCFEENSVLLCGNNFPTFEQFKKHYPAQDSNDNTLNDCFYYLFAIDAMRFFLYLPPHNQEQNQPKLELASPSLEKKPVSIFHAMPLKWQGFAGLTALHLHSWYSSNRYCGKCGKLFSLHDKERALLCRFCQNVVYPKISPVVIVGVVDDDKLLLTKYTNGIYDHYALVAGYADIGETIEQTVVREVREETGLVVKNLTYFASQPWGFSGSLLHGFFAQLDGSNTITLQTEELKEAAWFERSKIPVQNDGFSLTYQMIEFFKQGKM